MYGMFAELSVRSHSILVHFVIHTIISRFCILFAAHLLVNITDNSLALSTAYRLRSMSSSPFRSSETDWGQ